MLHFLFSTQVEMSITVSGNCFIYHVRALWSGASREPTADFNAKLFTVRKIKVNTVKFHDRLCALVFDEMSVKEFLQFSENNDKIEGFEDLGNGDTKRFGSKYDFVFMLMSLYSNLLHILNVKCKTTRDDTR